MESRRQTRSSNSDENATHIAERKLAHLRGPAGAAPIKAGLGNTRRALAEHGPNAAVSTRNRLNEKTNLKPLVSTQVKREDVKKPVKIQGPKPSVAYRNFPLHPEVVGFERELNCVDYCDDVYLYLLSLEQKQTIKEDFMKDQSVTPKMRYILVDWLIQVHQRFHLLPETLYLTVYLLDCMLSNVTVEKAELQLVGVACMLVASKYEEMFAPDITDFEYITDQAFSKRQILKMEMKVLNASELILSRPHSLIFIRWLTKELDLAIKNHNMAKYLSEVALLDYSIAHYLPSRIAVISLKLAAKLTGSSIDTFSLWYFIDLFLDFKERLENFVYGPITITVLTEMVNLRRSEAEEMESVLARAVLKQQSQHKMTALRGKYATTKLNHASSLSEEQTEMLTVISGTSA